MRRPGDLCYRKPHCLRAEGSVFGRYDVLFGSAVLTKKRQGCHEDSAALHLVAVSMTRGASHRSTASGFRPAMPWSWEWAGE